MSVSDNSPLEDIDFDTPDIFAEYDWEDDSLCSYPCIHCGEADEEDFGDDQENYGTIPALKDFDIQKDYNPFLSINWGEDDKKN